MKTKYQPLHLTWNDQPFDNDAALLAVLGCPFDGGATTSGGGQAMFPRAVRQSYVGPLLGNVTDIGDVTLHGASPTEYSDCLSEVVALESELLDSNQVARQALLIYGGDDSISLGVIAGLAKTLKRGVEVLHLDAHSDIGVDPDPLDHSNWITHAKRHIRVLDHVGVRAMGDDVPLTTRARGYKYDVICLDLDVIDPSQAPGVSTSEPFGLSSSEVLQRVLDATGAQTRALVVTEGNPSRDINDVTARLAFRIGQHFLAKVAQENGIRH